MDRLLPPLRLLTVFETVLRKGGVKPAAVELNVSQPAVSQALRQLEDHLGTKLLDRSRRPAGLTPAGQILRDATIEGLGRINDAAQEIRRLSAAPSSVTVACSVGFATYWLMPRLAGFYERHPEVVINVVTSPIGAPPVSRGIDIAFRYGDGAWTDGGVSLLFAEEIVPVCSPAFAGRFDDGENEFTDVRLIHVDVEDKTWITWPQYLRETGRPTRNRPGDLHFTNYVQATQAALTHQGVMLGWRSITADLVEEGRLTPLVDSPFRPDYGYYQVVAPHAASLATCKSVASWISAAVAITTVPARVASASTSSTAPASYLRRG